LKVWFAVKYYGARRLAEAISDDNALAQYLAEQIRVSEDFELLAPVELSICCFRYVPRSIREERISASGAQQSEINKSLDELNTRVMLSVQRGGKAYLSNATVRGQFALRICIVNFRTTRADIDETLNIIRAAAQAVEDS